MSPLPRQLSRFALVGLAGTAAYFGLYLALRGCLGAQAASLLARVLVALPTSWLNARYTFGSRVQVRRAYAAGLGGLALGASVSACALLCLHRVSPQPTRALELVTLAAAQCVGAGARFGLLRRVSRALTAAPQGAYKLHATSAQMVKVLEDIEPLHFRRSHP